MSTVFVEYVGKKPTRADTIADTGVVWAGPGDVQAVPVAAWEKLSRHPDVWALAEAPKAKPEPVSTEIPGVPGVFVTEANNQADPLDALDRDQLAALATERGIRFRSNASELALRDLLKAD